MSLWSETFQHEAHRPYPMPARAWSMHMSWQALLFAHWPFPAEVMRERIAAACGGWPAGLELDTYDGRAWLSIVPFRMARTGLRWWPTALGPHTFPELNVRTYVTAKDRHSGQERAGVFFFSLDAASPLAVFTARRWYHLPYFRARMTCAMEDGGADGAAPPRISYASERTHRGAPSAVLRARYGPSGPVHLSAPGTLESWLTERYCLYAIDRKLRTWRSDIHHQRWPLQDASAELAHNDLASCHGFELPPAAPLLQYVQNLDVIAWSPERVA
jgi:uncharacterized protein YqjF (DUF2071 family)